MWKLNQFFTWNTLCENNFMRLTFLLFDNGYKGLRAKFYLCLMAFAQLTIPYYILLPKSFLKARSHQSALRWILTSKILLFSWLHCWLWLRIYQHLRSINKRVISIMTKKKFSFAYCKLLAIMANFIHYTIRF